MNELNPSRKSPPKKNHHYVWRAYLKPWSKYRKTNQLISWLRNRSHQDVSNVKNLASGTYFYELESVSENEIELIKSLINRGAPVNRIVNNSNFDLYLSIANSSCESIRRYGMENIHNEVENSALDFFPLLLNGDLSFLEDRQKRFIFSRFLAFQYMRTKKIRENCPPFDEELISRYNDIDLFKIYRILSFVYTDSLTNFICNNATIYYLTNTTEVDFITTDQPVVNLLSTYGLEETKEVKIYYPVSTKNALLISADINENVSAGIDDVKYYNNTMASLSHELIFSLEPKSLTEYIIRTDCTCATLDS